MPPLITWLIFVWLLGCAWQDQRTRRVANYLTLPVLGGALVYRLVLPPSWLPLLCLAGLLLLSWKKGWLGGADVKGLLALGLLHLPWVAWALGGVGVYYLFAWLLARRKPGAIPAFPGFAFGFLFASLGEVMPLIF